jgi:hypothetical protein
MQKNLGFCLLLALTFALILPNSGVAHSQKATAYGILLDNSGSLEKQLPQVLMLGEAVVKRIRERGPVALFNFMTKPDIARTVVASGTGWTQDEKALISYMGTIAVQRQGQATILDAIYSVADEVNAEADAAKDAFGDKVIVLITDGEHRVRMEKVRCTGSECEDDERRRSENQLIKALKKRGIKVLAVGLVRELESNDGHPIRKSTRENAEHFLRTLAKETGVVFPKSKKIDVDSELNELLK